MADEEDAGASYLAALRQSHAPQAAGAAPAPITGSQRSINTPIRKAGAEKRKGPRYRCTGSVRLQPSGTSSSSWATFTDISKHGCYVESAVPSPQGAMLELKLDASGFRVEAVGEVRVSYPGLGMGISFTKMSESDRGQLHDLIASISTPSIGLGPRLATQSLSIPQSDPPPSATNPAAVLQAIQKFFEDRHVMGREEFLRILRKSQ